MTPYSQKQTHFIGQLQVCIVYDLFSSTNNQQPKTQKVCLELWLLCLTVTLSRQQLHFPRVTRLKELICFLDSTCHQSRIKSDEILCRFLRGYNNIRDTNPRDELRIDVLETYTSGQPNSSFFKNKQITTTNPQRDLTDFFS